VVFERFIGICELSFLSMSLDFGKMTLVGIPLRLQ